MKTKKLILIPVVVLFLISCEFLTAPFSIATPTSTLTPTQVATSTPSVINLEGTVWTGTDSDGEDFVYEFLSGGIFKYTVSGETYTNGTWEQDGTSVYIETNNKFAESDAVISGNTMTGTFRNIDGHEWTWTAERQP